MTNTTGFKGKSIFQSVRDFLLIWWKRAVVVGVCFTVLLIRIIFPKANIDLLSIALIGIITLQLVCPPFMASLRELQRILPYIRKINVAGFGVELTEEIRKLSAEVEKGIDEEAQKGDLIVSPDFQQNQAEILNELKSDPKSAFLLLAARIEKQIMDSLERHQLRRPGQIMPVRKAVQIGVEHGVFSPNIRGMVDDFWAIRNQVAHGLAFDVHDDAILSLNSLGLEILGLLSATSSKS